MFDEVVPSATPSTVDIIFNRPAAAKSHTLTDMQTSPDTPHRNAAAPGRANDRHGGGLLKKGGGRRDVLSHRSVSTSPIPSSLSPESADQRLGHSNSCMSVSSGTSATSTPAAVTDANSSSNMSCTFASFKLSSRSNTSSSNSHQMSHMSQSSVHQGSSIGSNSTQAASMSTAAPGALAATHAATPYIRHSQASRQDIRSAASRRLQDRTHHLNDILTTSSSASHDAAPTLQVGLPPGLLVRAADGGLVPRAGASTQNLSRAQAPARAPDISLAPAGQACLTFNTMSGMLNRSIQELLLTHSRPDFLKSVQVTKSKPVPSVHATSSFQCITKSLG